MSAVIIPDSVVACVDESEHAAVSVRWAADYAAQCEMPLRLLHAANPTGAESLFTRLPYEEYRQDLISGANGMLHRVRDELAHVYPTLSITCETLVGDPVQTLVEAGLGARLLVVGAYRHRAPFSLGIGHVLHPLLAHAPCPVAVVPSAER